MYAYVLGLKNVFTMWGMLVELGLRLTIKDEWSLPGLIYSIYSSHSLLDVCFKELISHS